VARAPCTSAVRMQAEQTLKNLTIALKAGGATASVASEHA
jgi:hypothetical protein